MVPSRVPTRQAALKALGAYDERAAPCSMSLLQASTEILPPASPLVCQRRRLKGELSIFTKRRKSSWAPGLPPFYDKNPKPMRADGPTTHTHTNKKLKELKENSRKKSTTNPTHISLSTLHPTYGNKHPVSTLHK